MKEWFRCNNGWWVSRAEYEEMYRRFRGRAISEVSSRAARNAERIRAELDAPDDGSRPPADYVRRVGIDGAEFMAPAKGP